VTTVSEELNFWDWCAKVSERLVFMRLNQLEHREITEGDYELLRVLFKPYYNGEYVIYQTIMEGTEPDVTQNSLFDSIPLKNIKTIDSAVADNTDMS
jgi:hypothetical protein